jgi:hypothetical protein
VCHGFQALNTASSGGRSFAGMSVLVLRLEVPVVFACARPRPPPPLVDLGEARSLEDPYSHEMKRAGMDYHCNGWHALIGQISSHPIFGLTKPTSSDRRR